MSHRTMQATRAHRILTGLLLGLLATVLLAAPASAHAELVSTDPAAGARLEQAPAQITLEFTEGVNLITDGLRLLDADGDEVATPEPVVEGSTVRWPMPAELPDGAYVASWRVVSLDSHPVSGAFSFGIGVAATDASAAQLTPVSVTWATAVLRFTGYLAFTVALGFFVLAAVCWPAAPRPDRLRRLGLGALAVGAAASLLALLVQGPYVAGLPLTRMLDPDLLSETAHTAFGGWTQIRIFSYLALLGVVWQDPTFRWGTTKAFAGSGAVGLAVSFSATGHAAASGRLGDLAVDAVHLLAAGVWAGGLVVLGWLALRDRERPSLEVFRRFSAVALGAVAVLVLTGSISSVIHLTTPSDLWQSTYGRLLSAKLLVVAVALAAAVVSRRLVHTAAAPWRSVRVEAAATIVVLAVTAVLGMTPPPGPSGPGSSSWLAEEGSSGTTVEMDLGDGRTALLHVSGLTTAGSDLHLEPLDADGRPLPLTDAEVKASLTGSDVGPVRATLTDRGGAWLGEIRFPLPGVWQLVLTVHDETLAGVVTTGEVTIAD